MSLSLSTAETIDQARRREFVVLLLISTGLIIIQLAIIAGIFGWLPARTSSALPSWAENVLVAIATASILKLGDCLAALVQLASGRQVAQLGERLASSAPTAPSDSPAGTNEDPLKTEVVNTPENPANVTETKP